MRLYKRIKRIIGRGGKFLLVIFAAMSLFFLAPHISKASHLGTSLFSGADGALDDTSHVSGIRNAMVQSWLSSWMMMTEQFVTVMMEQTFIIGTFLDAEQQLEVQRLFQNLAAQAHKDFQPSFQMCQLATNIKSLAAADWLSQENAKTYDSILKEREHLNMNLAASGGISLDVTHRIRAFKNNYCDLNENNRAVSFLCESSSGPLNRRTKDIDYPRMIDNKYTLDVNFMDVDETNDEKDIIALGHNLFGAVTFDFLPEQLMNEKSGQNLFFETRSVHAIRSVARHSLAKIIGMKAEGDDASTYQVAPFMYNIVHELGVPVAELEDFLGENPSYFAQMEVLTRKLYQSPEFFTNLYDKPANVERTGVALQAIELMQDRDRFKSALRRELLISLILELKLRQYQKDLTPGIYAAATGRFVDPDL